MQERTNGNAYGSVYDTQTSLPDSGPRQPRELIIDSRASDQLGSGDLPACLPGVQEFNTLLHYLDNYP